MWKRFGWLLWVVVLLFATPTAAQGERGPVIVLTAEGPLTPAMYEYLARGLRLAEQRGAQAVVFELNTPGGSIDLMNKMVETIRASRVPVVVYITPRGAMAGSAGTVITLAGHAAAMAPETVIGAASPVSSEGQDLGETMEAKAKNILKATVRSLAERRGEKAVQMAEETIESASAVSAREALEIGLVDFIAGDLQDLLRQLDGFTVQARDEEIVLHTAQAEVQRVGTSFIEKLLGVLTNPTLVFLLLTIGVQAILIELSSPGGWVAGFIGVVCLALAAYGLGVLPVNWFGVVFLITAFILFLLDIKAPTHGALTAAGVASLIVGALVLFNSPSVPNFQRVPVPVIVGTSLASGGIFFVILMFAVRAQKSPVRMGVESMVGRSGIAQNDINPVGLVQLGGEQWTAELAEGEEPIERNERVVVTAVQGLRLLVRKARK
ncbi:MAG: nodulation protein NfeD [Anaerolineales bacterium]|nr:nodulation protein NfeD [Anaerolineales bacterium]